MNARLAAVAHLDGQRSAGPVHRSILAVDLEGSTMRTNPVKGELRWVIYDLLGRSLEAVAITGNRLEPLIDRGDGVLALIRPHDDVPKTVLLDQLIPLLTNAVKLSVAQPAILARQADRAPEIWLYKHQDRISAWRFRRQGDGNAMHFELMILSWLSQGKQKP